MQLDVADLSHLSQVISQATAPAFLLGAVAGFLAFLVDRLGHLLERIRALGETTDESTPRARLKVDLPRLKLQAKYVNQAIFFAVYSAICTTGLVILAFASALLGFRHEQIVLLCQKHSLYVRHERSPSHGRRAAAAGLP